MFNFSSCSTFLAAAAIASGFAFAQPAAINVHGAVATPGGDPITGTRAYSIQFYDAPSGGNTIGAEFTGLVNVSPSGVFNLPLIPPAGIFVAAEVWYEIGIDTDEPADNDAGDDIFLGRVQLQSVPFSLLAAEASHVAVENVGDGSIDQAELSALDGVTSGIQSQLDTLGGGSNDNAADILALQGEQAIQDTAIAAKADAADVYTKTESDTNFVAVAGDTVTGVLAISDTTASTNEITGALTVAGGVGIAGDLNIGGEASADTMTIAPAGSPPATTTNKLYNVGGALFFAGTEISGDGPLGTSIESSEITDGTIATEDIADGAITAAKLDAGAITIADNSITSAKIVDGTVTGTDIAVNTIVNGNITANAITTSKIVDGTVTSAKIFDNTILDADVSATANISASKLNSSVVLSGEGNAQLTNDAGYLTAESDTLSAVTGRGATTSTQLTLNSGVKTDTVSEVTSANGVSVDGVKMKDSFLELTSISAPSPTTNRLYNEGGTLKFNGTALGGGGGTNYSIISWEIIAFNSTVAAGRDVVKFKAPFAGTITSFQCFLRTDLSSVGTADLRINGSSVIGGEKTIATFFTDDTLNDKSSLLSSATFNAGDVISFYGNCSSGQLAQPQVTLVLTY